MNPNWMAWFFQGEKGGLGPPGPPGYPGDPVSKTPFLFKVGIVCHYCSV